MGLLDELKKLTKPYDDEDYFEEDLAEPIRAPERRQQPNRPYASYADYAEYANPPQQEDYGRGGYAVNPQQNTPAYNPYASQQAYAPQQGYAAPQQPYAQPGYGDPYDRQAYAPQQPYGQDMGFGAPAQARMLLVKPERFEEAADIADRFRERNTIILNLEVTPKDVSRRLLDFLSGVTYALNGKIKRAAGNTFVITPAGMDFAGDALDGFETRGTYF